MLDEFHLMDYKEFCCPKMFKWPLRIFLSVLKQLNVRGETIIQGGQGFNF